MYELAIIAQANECVELSRSIHELIEKIKPVHETSALKRMIGDDSVDYNSLDLIPRSSYFDKL